LKRFISDKHGKIIIWQAPNLPLLGWFAFFVISRLFSGQLSSGFSQVSTASLFVWAYLEITDGANYFRRLLGGVVMFIIVLSFFG